MTRPDAAAKTAAKADAITGAYAAPDTPQRMIPAATYTVKVTLTNVTSTPWAAATQALSYHWTLPDGTEVSDPSNQQRTSLPGDLAPGASVAVDAKVTTPGRLSGSERRALVLKWDLYDTADRSWLSQTGDVATLDQQITVDDPTSDQLGLERFYQYSGIAAGAGSNLLANQSSGNAVFSYDALSNPSRGLATFVRLTYNSLDSSNSYAGYGWSVAASTLSRLGSPLRFDGLAAPGWPQRITYTDGDGTDHTFTIDKHGTSDTSQWGYYTPAGVHLYLRKTDGGGWSMTRPDRTQALFDAHGYQSATVDKNGNQLTFHYQPAIIGGHQVQALTDIVDATGRRTLTLDYAQPGDQVKVFHGKTKKTLHNLTDLDVVGKLLAMTDIAGRKITFTYADDGTLRQITDGAGGPQPKTFSFTYSSDTKLTRVTDPVGNASTLTYAGQNRLGQLTDRRGKATSLAYGAPDHANGDQTTSAVTDANGHATRYVIDAYGRPTQLTDAKSENTLLSWDADNNVVKLVENNGATTTWRYDPKTGYPLEIRGAEANKHDYPGTVLTYNTGLDGRIADLATKTSSEGRKWVFGYDEHGNLISVTDPKGSDDPTSGDYTTRYGYDGYGQLVKTTDANGHSTAYGDYDPSGYPRTTADPFGCRTVAQYDVTGNVVMATDANNHTGTYSYDLFDRPLTSRVPKDQAKNQYIVTPAPRYDANDNVLQSTAPNGAITTTHYDADDNVVAVTAPKDEATRPAKTSTNVYDAVGNLLRSTAPKGTLTSDPDDYTITYVYDVLNRPVSVTDPAGHRATTTYDDVGNVIKQVDPNKNATSDPDDFTSKYTYDLNHQVLTTTDAKGAVTSVRYDKDGNVVAVTDPDGNTTETTYDQRSMPVKVRVPHAKDGASVTYNTTTYDYDQVGNKIKTVDPRGYAAMSVYDAMNRVKEQDQAYSDDDSQANKPDPTYYGYNRLGDLTQVSAPPSSGQQVRNVTTTDYFDNGWIKSSKDAWDITTSYAYDDLGDQTARTLTGDGGSAQRTMHWEYYPDGKLKSRSDDGVPPGDHVVVVDNSDADATKATGTWATAGTDEVNDHEGYDYRTHDGGNSTDSFAWSTDIPADGTYEVFARYPKTATATDATYTIEHDGGQTAKKVDQTQQAGDWVSLGSYSYTADTTKKITLSAAADGTVAADAVKLVRDHSGEDPSNQRKTFTQTYDPDNNLIGLTDDTTGAAIDAYTVGYDQLDQPLKVEEKNSGDVKHTTTYTYDANGNPLTNNYDDYTSTYTYDPLNLISKITNKTGDQKAKDTTFEYNKRGEAIHEVKGNNNTVDIDYFLDGLLQHQVEKKSGGDIVNEHTPTYDADGNRIKDVAKIQNADDHALKTTTTTSTYDARDRVTKVEKSGADDSTESYTHDANNNVVKQTVADTTNYNYDRNRLTSASANGTTSTDRYDSFGRLDHVTAAGQLSEKYTYDGFDRTAKYQQGSGAGAATTTYTYDPLDRTTSEKTGGATSHTTDLHYLGLSNQVLDENLDGELNKSYQYSANGALLAQTTFGSDGTAQDSFYGYNPHTDVEEITSDTGDTQATYGYTAYGQNDDKAFTGADKPNPTQPDAQPFNSYRYNAKRVDLVSGNYDMGFRDYSPGQNRFLTLDLYNGALNNLSLTTDSFTNNRYAFGGGNPIGNTERDGHEPGPAGAQCDSPSCWPTELNPGEAYEVNGGCTTCDPTGWHYNHEAGQSRAGIAQATLDASLNFTKDTITSWKQRGESTSLEDATKIFGTTFESALKQFGLINTNIGWRSLLTVGAVVTIGGGALVGCVAGGCEGGYEAAGAACLRFFRTCTAAVAGLEGILEGLGGASSPTGAGVRDAEEGAKWSLARFLGKCNSFTADTKVLMADGTTKPIEDVKIGDKVKATDPKTGKTVIKKVAAAFGGTNYDHLVQITVDTDGNKGHRTGVIVATEHHLFWNPARRIWIRADQLTSTSSLRVPGGHTVHVVHAYYAFGHPAVYDLTITGIHTYYVEAGTVPVLVHNSGGCGIGRELLGDEASGHILEGHAYPGLPGKTVFPKEWSDNNILDAVADVVTDPASTRVWKTGSAKYAERTLMTRKGDPAVQAVIGTVRGVTIEVRYEPLTGRVLTAFPR